MRLRIMFALYPGSDLMPNALAITDEYMEDEHGGVPSYFSDEVAKEIENSEDGTEIRFAFVHVADEAVANLFRTPTVRAVSIEPVEEPE